ncbi:MAG: hypothetical protein JRN09_09830 [Nitrososphaerota archaeon]|nr:hypothetical protein [Nitrososphaerota archaeon]
MAGPGQTELCEHCGSPLDESGLCWSCGGAGGFQAGSSPVGTAPAAKKDAAKILGRGIGDKAYAAYFLSTQQEEGMSHLRGEIDSLVEQFDASPELKRTVKQSSERNAVKLLPDLGPSKAAIASVAHEFLIRGRTMAEVSFCISSVRPRVARLSGLIARVYVPDEGVQPEVLVRSRSREFVSYSEGLYRRLRIPVYCWDDGALVELRHAILCRRGNQEKRMRVLGPSRFRLTLPERTFQLFKILEDAKLSGAVSSSELVIDPVQVVRKYSIARLTFTERFLRETGYLNRVSARYNDALKQKLIDGGGRMPRKLAEEALMEACQAEVPQFVSDLVVAKYRLKPTEMDSLIVLPELEAWQRMDTVS